MNEYITVKELAELNGISKVTVTNRLIKEGIQPHHIDETTKTKYYSTAKLPQSLCADKVQNGTKNTANNYQDTTNSGANIDSELISILREQLAVKDRQIAVKDRQIEELNNSLREVTRIASQQQYLTAQQQKPVFRLFSHRKNKDSDTGQF